LLGKRTRYNGVVVAVVTVSSPAFAAANKRREGR